MPFAPFGTSRFVPTDLNTALSELNTAIHQAADQSVTASTTLVPSLYINPILPASSTWKFKLCIFYTASTSGDLVLQISIVGTGHNVQPGHWRAAFTETVTPSSIDHGGGSTNPYGMAAAGIGTGTLATMRTRGILTIGSEDGLLNLNFAQFVSDAGATTLRRGSFILLSRVA